MKSNGKVIKYNGLYGIIKTKDNKNIMLLDKDIIDKTIDVNDEVEFEIEEEIKDEITIKFARYVKLAKNDRQNSN